MTDTSAERRTWYLEEEDPGDRNPDNEYFIGYRHSQYGQDLVHVTELRPGEIVLSRERLREAYDKYHTEYELPYIDDLERELFGEGEK
jgi:hypothetical protein